VITICRRIQFCAGHRVCGHENKCRNLHGHNYVAHIHARAPELDTLGRVIDFSVLKEKVGGWIDANIDHSMILFDKDVLVQLYKQNVSLDGLGKLFTMPMNPTAENIADFLLNDICPKLLQGTGVEVYAIELEETENCKAIVQL
jgi:6-pyruvoyltetrahydropterin/6-carboxytetrahydropterin synthase